jgi:tetratricopeptide (TPR) repeat protein
VAAAKALQELAEEVLRDAVIAERQDGTAWEVIGKALGTSRSGAHGRFAEDVNEWRRTHPRTAHQDAQARLDSSWTGVEDLARQQLLLDPDRLEDAEQFLRQSAAEGSAHAATGLAELLVHTGRHEEAEECLRTAVAERSAYAAVALAHLLVSTGRSAEAEELLRQAEVDGNCYAPVALAQLLVGTGRADDAEKVLRRAVDRGDNRATTALARLLLDSDRPDEAEHLLRQASACGDRRAASALAGLTAADCPDEVDEYLRSAALETLHLTCHGAAARLLDAGHADAAQQVLRGAARNDVAALLWLNARRGAALWQEQELSALLHGAGHGLSLGDEPSTFLLIVPTGSDHDPGSSLQAWLAKSAAGAKWGGKPLQIKPALGDQRAHLARLLEQHHSGVDRPPILWRLPQEQPPAAPESDRISALERRLAKLEAQATARAQDGSGPEGKAGSDPP